LQYEVDVGGKRLRVSLAREGNGFAVTVDKRTWHVDAARIDAHTLSLLLNSRVSAGGQARPGTSKPGHVGPSASREVVVTTDPVTAQLTVGIGAVPMSVSLNGRRRGRRDEAGVSGSSPQRLVAPMPGKIVRVLVKAGEAVRSRQPVVVVEAMKMENELRAGRDGTVAEVHAREGASVDAGALLIVIQ
jgi:biotin carboxyl carrier protein